MGDKDEKYWKITDNAQVIINPNSSSSQAVEAKKEWKRETEREREVETAKHD